MHRAVAVIAASVLVASACGGSSGAGTSAAGYQEYECPAPIGRIVREDCSRSALQYEGTTFSGSAGAAGIGASASYREDAIRQADALVAMLKEQRVGLCNDFNTCKLGVAEYREEKKQLDASFVALLALKDKMAQLDAEGAAKLLGELRMIRTNVAKTGAASPTESKAASNTVSGKWGWTCCDRAYSGDLLLQQDGQKVTGAMLEPNGNSSPLDGEITGGRLRLTRPMSPRSISSRWQRTAARWRGRSRAAATRVSGRTSRRRAGDPRVRLVRVGARCATQRGGSRRRTLTSVRSDLDRSRSM